MAELRDLATSSLRAEWKAAKAHLTPDSLAILGQPVMERWETPYMRRLAEAVCANKQVPVEAKEGRRILEVGFGLGISAGFVSRMPGVTEHVIIEANDQVAKLAVAFAQSSPVKSSVINDFWQAATPKLASASFDGVLFDVFPLTREELVDGESEKFFTEACRLLRPGGVFTFYFDVAKSWYHCKKAFREVTVPLLKQAGFSTAEHDEVEVEPSPDCAYFWGHHMLVPVVHK